MSVALNRECDLLIVGAGPAGLAAALEVAPSGARIVILDDNPRPGGQIWRDGPGVRLPRAARRLRSRVAAAANIEILCGARVVAACPPKALLIEMPEGGALVSCTKLILCTGARERLLPFPGWTLPGVTGAGGLQALIKGGLDVAGERVVVAGSGPLLLAGAATARTAGAKVLQIAEQAGREALVRFGRGLWRWPGKALQALRLWSPVYRAGSHVFEALGDQRLEAVRIRSADAVLEIACDRLACGFGLIPNTQLGELLGCAIVNGAIAVDALQATSIADCYAAGECTGFGGSELALVEGRIAGLAASGQPARAAGLAPQRERWRRFAAALERAFVLDPVLRTLPTPDTLVCRCEDVPYAALAGCRDWVEAKLASRCGMGACQGRTCGAAVEFLFGWSPPAPRPPLFPVRTETLLRLADRRHSPPARPAEPGR
jgi:NADPH-dependent 2,4-dienoyl-CoA reductase/sulfur reductase-like enzyme